MTEPHTAATVLHQVATTLHTATADLHTAAAALHKAATDPHTGEPPATVTDQIREAATFASITLGILSAFAAQRAASLGAQRADLNKFSARTLRRDFLLDVALAAFGLLLLVASSPLFVAAADRITPLLRTDTAFFSLFCLFFLGVLGVVIWVAAMARRRAGRLTAKTHKSLFRSVADSP